MKTAVALTLTERATRCTAVNCYQNGEFVLPDISVTEMQARVREKIVEFGMPRVCRRNFCAQDSEAGALGEKHNPAAGAKVRDQLNAAAVFARRASHGNFS